MGHVGSGNLNVGAVCYSARVSRALGIWFALLGGGLASTLIAQPRAGQVVGEASRERQLNQIGRVMLQADSQSPPAEAIWTGPTVDVQNRFGAVRVQVRAVEQPRVEASVQGRTATDEDYSLAREGASFRIQATPLDGARIDLEMTVPYGYLVRAVTADGDLAYEGFGKADLQTDRGAVSLRFPEEATSFELLSFQAPERFAGEADVWKSEEVWSARDRLPEGRHAYGRVTLRSDRPRAVTVELTAELPEDSPIRPHWRAKELLPELFLFARKGLRKRDAPREAEKEASEPKFSADVRLVQLDVAATDREGRPVADLTREDFEVVENGKAQGLDEVSTAAQPFNLVLLLDCSSSTEEDRPAIEEAARRFIDTAREGDRVAVYALAETYFQVLSRLTEDHEAAKASVVGIERFGGATPLYDAIVLAYAEELAALPRERNAMIVLSDGLDNEIYGHRDTSQWASQSSTTRTRQGGGAPSMVLFDDIRRAAREMRALIYPIVLDPAPSFVRVNPEFLEEARRWAGTVHQRSTALAEESGGTLFEADSLEDLDEVYEQVARELRSVYRLAYRPRDQEFDGKWRRVRLRTNRKGVEVRTRPGYYAY